MTKLWYLLVLSKGCWQFSYLSIVESPNLRIVNDGNYEIKSYLFFFVIGHLDLYDKKMIESYKYIHTNTIMWPFLRMNRWNELKKILIFLTKMRYLRRTNSVHKNIASHFGLGNWNNGFEQNKKYLTFRRKELQRCFWMICRCALFVLNCYCG